MTIKNWDDVWLTEITGMWLQSCDIKMSVGNFPKVSFNICMNHLIEKQSNENLERLKKLVDKEIQYRKDMIPKRGYVVVKD